MDMLALSTVETVAGVTWALQGGRERMGESVSLNKSKSQSLRSACSIMVESGASGVLTLSLVLILRTAASNMVKLQSSTVLYCGLRIDFYEANGIALAVWFGFGPDARRQTCRNFSATTRATTPSHLRNRAASNFQPMINNSRTRINRAFHHKI